MRMSIFGPARRTLAILAVATPILACAAPALADPPAPPPEAAPPSREEPSGKPASAARPAAATGTGTPDSSTKKPDKRPPLPPGTIVRDLVFADLVNGEDLDFNGIYDQEGPIT